MTQQVWSDVDAYFADRLHASDAVLESALEAGASAGLPAIQVSPNQGKFLFLLAKAIGARKILELGTLAGYSAIWLARALPDGGRLVTLEVDPRHAEVARRNVDRAGVGHAIDIRLGPALDALPQIEAEGLGPFDFIFIDADKNNYPLYFAWSLRLAHVASVIVADNVVRDGAVLDANSADPAVQGVRRFVADVSDEPRVSASTIQTVGAKGYDGFTMVVVTGDEPKR